MTSEYVQLGPDAEIPQFVLESDRCIQLYDHHGKPINPLAEEYARRLRYAMNDVQAAAGVIERKPSPPDETAEKEQEREELERKEQELRKENVFGERISVFFSLTSRIVGCWFAPFRNRILIFVMPEALPFSQIISREWQLSGPHILYAGIPAILLAELVYKRLHEVCSYYRLFDRLLWKLNISRKTKLRLRSTLKES